MHDKHRVAIYLFNAVKTIVSFFDNLIFLLSSWTDTRADNFTASGS